ncbi:MAG: hypothetical protein HY360_23605 [Verrucomicrobia bacterium]|nr:hypothetical protein [Verrucomicrobiota bacterium]
MRSRATRRFWRLYGALPPEIRRAARKQYAFWRRNPRHGSVHFKQIKADLWSARVTEDYRALATREADAWLWFWIGPHDEYERLIKS